MDIVFKPILTDTMDQNTSKKLYWRKNLQTLFSLLLIWFVVSFGFGIILVEYLNAIKLGGFKLGFWFAQQGSIYSFVILIFVYVYRMDRLDKEFDVNEN
ncbi:Sodium:solute symporter associated protein [Mariniradius saccharolyticus AK6]|uniref:Sodium:solute symporter associated protein n=2 Tax=Mariniradius TaxID=1245590 RepID=M7XCW4_9BACT|nr:Sodium:solute symporter associated protein [Mariniradius saccharolyticus AK6]